MSGNKKDHVEFNYYPKDASPGDGTLRRTVLLKDIASVDERDKRTCVVTIGRRDSTNILVNEPYDFVIKRLGWTKRIRRKREKKGKENGNQ